jgi:hypothetical protein
MRINGTNKSYLFTFNNRSKLINSNSNHLDFYLFKQLYSWSERLGDETPLDRGYFLISVRRCSVILCRYDAISIVINIYKTSAKPSNNNWASKMRVNIQFHR